MQIDELRAEVKKLEADKQYWKNLAEQYRQLWLGVRNADKP